MRKITYTNDESFGRIMITDKSVIIFMVTTDGAEHISVVPKTNKHQVKSLVADAIGNSDIELNEIILADLLK